jgi:protein involved in polysaccharide export with SLBB domain
MIGCNDKVALPSAEQLAEFKSAGPLRPSIDMDLIVKAKITGEPYKVKPDEVLELTMPAILRIVTTEDADVTERDTRYICRISENGTIAVPIVGEIDVAGKTLAQIESNIIDAYYPKYALTLPSVFARVLEYKTAKVSICGAVEAPGVYSLRSDQMSLVALVMEAGGIINEGAAFIRIVHSESINEQNDQEVSGQVRENTNRQTYNSVGLAESSMPVINTNKIEVQLSYKQISAQNTSGVMKIISNDKVLFSEYMDITSEIERLALLKRLSWREPRISIDEMERKLYALAKSIESDLDRRSIDRTSIKSDIRTEYTKHMGNFTPEQEGRVFADNATTWPKARPKMLKTSDGGFSVANNIFNQNIYSNTEFNNDNSKQNTKKAINRELLEILDIVTDQKVPENNMENTIQESETIVLPVKGFNIPFVDVTLRDGDTVIVERLEQPLFSVIGLVNRPGNFPYPPDVKYNLMQALAFAGGLDSAAEPRYTTIYRLKPNGMIVHVTFEIVNVKNSAHLTDSLNVQVKPGDIISVEHTPRTRTNVFLDRVFRINVGTYFNLTDAWDE